MIAALFVEPGGVYYGLPDVDPWDEARDARLYPGPYPVVAHPPCKAWSLMSQCRKEIQRGADDGCFESALSSVRNYGGVLEHPAYSSAWSKFGLRAPAARGWSSAGDFIGWTCEIDQAHYGHRTNKRTWLYFCGVPMSLEWGNAPFTGLTVRNDGGGGRDQRSRTPPRFRDLLLGMARSVYEQQPA